MTETAANIFRDYNTPSVPGSGEYQPDKALIRRWGTGLETLVATGALAGATWKTTKALLDADLAHAAGSIGVVYDDSTSANNGFYEKSGASGAGSWSQIFTFLPGYQFIKATDAGAGSADAIQATTVLPVPTTAYAAMILMNVFETNPGAVTIALNGGSAKELKTNSGNDLAAGYLQAGMLAAFVDDGTNYRLLTDVASASIQAAAEAAQAAAEAAAAAASGAVADRTALKAINTGTITSAHLGEGVRAGWFLWNAGDLSSILLGSSIASSAVNVTTETITSVGHGLATGHAVVVTSAVNGLSTNTLYYAIRVDADNFKLASSHANAVAGTAFNLTGTSAVTVKRHFDPREGVYVCPTADITGASGAWVRQHGGELNTRMFGTAADNSNDDTAALQGALDLAIALQIFPLRIGGGVHLTSGTLKCWGNINLKGNGFQGDRGLVYDAAYETQPSTDYASVIKPNGSFLALEIKARGSVNLSEFEIDFGSATPTSSAIGIRFLTPDETNGGILTDRINVYTRIVGVAVVRAYYGFWLTDVYDARISGCGIFNCEGWGIVHNQTIFTSYGDSTIEGCYLFNNQAGGILWQSGGGLRIVNNKINYGNVSTSVGIWINPNLNTTAQIEPYIILGNSIEGQNQGIVFQRASGNTECTQGVIDANQIWAGGSAIAIVNSATAPSPWINGLAITGNSLASNVDGSTIVNVDGTKNCLIAANTLIYTAGSGSVSGIAWGANTVTNEQGHNRRVGSVSAPTVTTPGLAASTVAMTNTYFFPIFVAFYGGTATQVNVNGAAQLVQSAGALNWGTLLNPGDTIAVTYTVAMDMYWRGISP